MNESVSTLLHVKFHLPVKSLNAPLQNMHFAALHLLVEASGQHIAM